MKKKKEMYLKEAPWPDYRLDCLWVNCRQNARKERVPGESISTVRHATPKAICLQLENLLCGQAMLTALQEKP